MAESRFLGKEISGGAVGQKMGASVKTFELGATPV
jgi:hypothetical protein